MLINYQKRAKWRNQKIRKKVFWYKAKKREDFAVGCKKFISFHVDHFDKNYDNYNKLKDIADEMVITAFNSRWEHQNK